MKLHPKSQQIIDETFALYENCDDKCPSLLKGRTIIHMYPAGDTMDKDGNLNGYYQNLFFKMVVFNIHGKSMKRYDIGKRDAVFTTGSNISNLSVFKDGGFCITFEGDHEFLDSQAPTIFLKK